MSLIHNIEVVDGGTGPTILTKTTSYYKPVNVQDCDGVLFILTSHSSDIPHAANSSMVLRVDCASATDATFKPYGTTNTKLSTTNPMLGVAYSTGEARNLILDIVAPKVRWLKPCIKGATHQGTILAIKYGLRHAGSTSLNQLGGSSAFGHIGIIGYSTKST